MTQEAVIRIIREQAALFGCASAYDDDRTAQVCAMLSRDGVFDAAKAARALAGAEQVRSIFYQREYWSDYCVNTDSLVTCAAARALLSRDASPCGALYLCHVNDVDAAVDAMRRTAKGGWKTRVAASTQRAYGVEMPLTDIPADDFFLRGVRFGRCLFQRMIFRVAQGLTKRYQGHDVAAGCVYWDGQRGQRCDLRADILLADGGVYVLFRAVFVADGGEEERLFQVWFAPQGRHFRMINRDLRAPAVAKPVFRCPAVCGESMKVRFDCDPAQELPAAYRGITARQCQPDSCVSGGSLLQRMWLDAAAAAPYPVSFRGEDLLTVWHCEDMEDESYETDYEMRTAVFAFSDAEGTWVFFRFWRYHAEERERRFCQTWFCGSDGRFRMKPPYEEERK